MSFLVTADTDVGIRKKTNQDSVLIKHAIAQNEEVLMAIVCDGMGGLSKGELASATVIKEFSQWFDTQLPLELQNLSMQVIVAKWSNKLKELNVKISNYSKKIGVEGIGTTFTGVLFIGEEYALVHVGDSRLYKVDENLKQLTKDQTFVAREIERGNMTLEQAKVDKRRNLLLQCVGASKIVEPQITCGKIERGTYMICSDGFRHEISDDEIFNALKPKQLTSKEVMHAQAKMLIEKVKSRQEKDNISVILIKVQ